MKCDVPSFVADFVQVVGWEDETSNVYSSSSVNAQGTLHRQLIGLRICNIRPLNLSFIGEFLSLLFL